jgi:hypothetical protein
MAGRTCPTIAFHAPRIVPVTTAVTTAVTIPAIIPAITAVTTAITKDESVVPA